MTDLTLEASTPVRSKLDRALVDYLGDIAEQDLEDVNIEAVDNSTTTASATPTAVAGSERSRRVATSDSRMWQRTRRTRASMSAAGSPILATQQQMLQIQDEPAYFRTRRRNGATKPMPPVKLQKYLIDYLVIDQQLKAIAAQTGRQPLLEFAAAAYDLDGRMLNGIVNDASASPPAAGEKAAALFRVEQELSVPLQAAWLRIAVRDMLTDRTGALEIPLPLKPEPLSQAKAEAK